jgi:hypothetical protein
MKVYKKTNLFLNIEKSHYFQKIKSAKFLKPGTTNERFTYKYPDFLKFG